MTWLWKCHCCWHFEKSSLWFMENFQVLFSVSPKTITLISWPQEHTFYCTTSLLSFFVTTTNPELFHSSLWLWSRILCLMKLEEKSNTYNWVGQSFFSSTLACSTLSDWSSHFYWSFLATSKVFLSSVLPK